MAPTGRGQDRHEIPTSKSLAGILALLVEEREERLKGDGNATKIEQVLDNAGLSHDDIAAVTGKNANAIRVALHRAKKRKPRRRA